MVRFAEIQLKLFLVLFFAATVALWVINALYSEWKLKEMLQSIRHVIHRNSCFVVPSRIANDWCHAETNDKAEMLKQLLEEHSFDKDKVILAAANMGHLKLVLNWVENMRRNVQQDDKFLIGCFDKSLCKSLRRRNIPSFLVEDYIAVPNITSEQKWGTTDYNNVVNTKIKFVNYIVNTLNYTVIFSDVDTAWLSPQILSLALGQLNNPLDPKDITFAQDHRHLCTGFYAVRPTPFIKKFYSRILTRMSKKDTNDQFIVAFLYERLLNETDKAKIGKLPVFLYMNGNTIRDHPFSKPSAVRPWFVHANSAVGLREKILQLKKAKAWLI